MGASGSERSEFYPYRYLASEGFLPGYNFTRLPLRVFIPGGDSTGEFISRPRTIALREFVRVPHSAVAGKAEVQRGRRLLHERIFSQSILRRR